MNKLEWQVTRTMERMEAADYDIARQAKREGWPVVGRGSVVPGGPVFVTVEIPAEWRKLEAWRHTYTKRLPAAVFDC
jgi:hypothetical protein